MHQELNFLLAIYLNLPSCDVEPPSIFLCLLVWLAVRFREGMIAVQECMQNSQAQVVDYDR